MNWTWDEYDDDNNISNADLWTWDEYEDDYNISNADLFGCDFDKEQFIDYVNQIGLTRLLETSHVRGVLYGPTLWSFCWLGIAFNILVIFPNAFLAFSAASIYTSSISLILIIQALLLLCQWDFQQGMPEPFDALFIYSSISQKKVFIF